MHTVDFFVRIKMPLLMCPQGLAAAPVHHWLVVAYGQLMQGEIWQQHPQPCTKGRCSERHLCKPLPWLHLVWGQRERETNETKERDIEREREREKKRNINKKKEKERYRCAFATFYSRGQEMLAISSSMTFLN